MVHDKQTSLISCIFDNQAWLKLAVVGIGKNMACARIPTGFVDKWADQQDVHLHLVLKFAQVPTDQGGLRNAVPGGGQGQFYERTATVPPKSPWILKKL